MRIPFTKMHGAGNDFIVIDNRPGYLSGMEHERIRWLCDRHLGIGADGLMLIEPATDADFSLAYFNADGYPAEICGNGARCAVVFAKEHGFFEHTVGITIATAHQQYQANYINSHRAAVRFALPQPFEEKPRIASEIQANAVWYGNAGVPHVVVWVDELPDSSKIVEVGRFLRYHPEFQPAGTNVNVIAIRESGWLRARVYERGVEAETLACGTGALACAVAAHQFLSMNWPILVEYPGGVLQVSREEAAPFLWLEGPVATVFEGEVEIPDADTGELA